MGTMLALPVYIFCYGSVTFLVYRRLSSERNLGVSLQYQLPLDSGLALSVEAAGNS